MALIVPVAKIVSVVCVSRSNYRPSINKISRTLIGLIKLLRSNKSGTILEGRRAVWGRVGWESMNEGGMRIKILLLYGLLHISAFKLFCLNKR